MDETTSRSLYSLLTEWSNTVAGTSLPRPPAYDGPDVALTGFVEHTDHVVPGNCFVARVRTGSDGHPYIDQAIARGASLILGQRPRDALGIDLDKISYLQVEDTAVTLAWLSAAWHDFPSRELVVVGVTGTDGKTTTTNLIFHILRAAGLRAGMLSTISAAVGETHEPLALHVTTPEAPIVQGYLRRMVDAGLTHCVLEATSHGLAQHRVDAVDFDVAVVTNITHEHLDYHRDYDGYFAAKSRLFEGLAKGNWKPKGIGLPENTLIKTAVLNADDPSIEKLATIPVLRQLTYGILGGADVGATDIVYEPNQTHFQISLPVSNQRRLQIDAAMPGRFNVYNMLAAAAAGQALGLQASDIQRGLEAVSGLSGRMERIDRGQEFIVLVDFAHTPNALEGAVATARLMAGGRVITVFGSAGRRDVAKRRLMAEISAREADISVLTAEDPRTESLQEILDMMATACQDQGGVEGQTFWRVPDRGQAIHFALTLARPHDLVLVCGKGHEQSMCFGETEYPWDDRQATEQALDALLTGRPMMDLGLPTFQPGFHP